jgi:methionyl-tRNA formyltransferase
MKVIILTSNRSGSVSYILEQLIACENIIIGGVVLSQNNIKNKKKHYKRKLHKVLKIGLLGTLNGIRMRKWYNNDIQKFLDIKPVDQICSENNIPFMLTPTINCQQTILYFKKVNADIGLSLGNGYIGSKIFNIPPNGMINIHHEELPSYQNAQSIIWQLYNNSRYTGYTIHKINKHIDKGEIIYKERLPIIFYKKLADTVSYNYSRLWINSARGLIKVLNNFDKYNKNSKQQGKGNIYTTPTIFQYLKIVYNFRKLKRTSVTIKR